MAKQKKSGAVHGGVRDGHVATIRRGIVSLLDRSFTQTDEGRLYAAFCECGATGLGETEAIALATLSQSPTKGKEVTARDAR